MKIKAKLSISRPVWSDGKSAISIRVEDCVSGIEFMDLEIPLAGFAEALTGLAMVDCDADVRALENVGKQHEHEIIEFRVGDVNWDQRQVNACLMAHKATPPGWYPPTYFGSQHSFFERDGEQWARGNMERWV